LSFSYEHEEAGKAGEDHDDDSKQAQDAPVHALGHGGVGLTVASGAGEGGFRMKKARDQKNKSETRMPERGTTENAECGTRSAEFHR